MVLCGKRKVASGPAQLESGNRNPEGGTDVKNVDGDADSSPA
jgi:hypothetical protein